MKIGQRLQAIRERVGLSQAELAKESEVPVGTIKGIEQGWRLPSWPTLHRICRALKADLGALSGLELEDEPPVRRAAKK